MLVIVTNYRWLEIDKLEKLLVIYGWKLIIWRRRNFSMYIQKAIISIYVDTRENKYKRKRVVRQGKIKVSKNKNI